MSWISKLFKKKSITPVREKYPDLDIPTEDPPEGYIPNPPQQEVQEVPIPKINTTIFQEPEVEFPTQALERYDWVCEYCKGTIDVGEKWSKFQGNHYHRGCFKELKKRAFNGQ